MDRVRAAGIRELAHYQRSWLRRDVPAGLTVVAYLVPQVMAYAGVAGLAPVAGLWAAVPAMLVYALFGSSRQLSVGPVIHDRASHRCGDIAARAW